MKIESNTKAFKPITITLETAGEARALQKVLNAYRINLGTIRTEAGGESDLVLIKDPLYWSVIVEIDDNVTNYLKDFS